MKKKLLIALFAVSTLALTACGGGTTPEEDRDDVKDVEVPATLACEEGMSEYQVAGTPIQFCYDPAWGAVVVAPETLEVGSSTKVSFDGGKGPELWYQSTDAKTEFCFTCINPTAPEDQLTAEVVEQLKLTDTTGLKVRKTDIFGARGVRVHHETTVSYFIPNAFEGYNMTVSSPDEAAADLDDFIYNMIL